MSAPAYEYSDDPAVYRAERASYEDAERLVRALILAAGGPFEQRQPTGAQCLTGVLDGLAQKTPAWLRSWAGRSVLQRYGLTQMQVATWRESAEGVGHV
jgi:hypothetical protein